VGLGVLRIFYFIFLMFFKKLLKMGKFLKKCPNFRKYMLNSSYTYRMKEKLVSACAEFDGKVRKRVRFRTR
jgi:hypothetical protein